MPATVGGLPTNGDGDVFNISCAGSVICHCAGDLISGGHRTAAEKRGAIESGGGRQSCDTSPTHESDSLQFTLDDLRGQSGASGKIDLLEACFHGD